MCPLKGENYILQAVKSQEREETQCGAYAVANALILPALASTFFAKQLEQERIPKKDPDMLAAGPLQIKEGEYGEKENRPKAMPVDHEMI